MGEDEPAPGNVLGAFLRTRRASLRPEDAGLPATGRRRVPGLRREEVALLAGVSTDYYRRLEQGRERHPSAQVLDAVAAALRLDARHAAHLRSLAPTARRVPRTVRTERVDRCLRQMIHTWCDTPAFVLGRTGDILARNGLADALHAPFTRSDNLPRMTFLDPAARDVHRDWSRSAAACAALLLQAADTCANDPGLVRLVGELSVHSQEFRTLWARGDMRGRLGGTALFHHPEVGDLDLHCETFTVDGARGQRLVVHHAEPGSPSADALALLGSLAAPGPARGG
ncbi:helix-turn-helix transcriptional regulator [Streptomyces sp. MP131-18]|uniref:helix-turn-helix domain-containing protein n=1 Tax=Streptomyces sp. MP131-18 TaxID=1857892 RepID=UPI00097C6775|nr:helix-turn-helix transcriptional regulator [Streptomyces sp. MP131-18]ONK09357.1 helix-turn-helix protein [Streptomyces sp. MP131-18]